MTECDIHIISCEGTEEFETGIGVDITLHDADIADKCLILHSLAKAMGLSKVDLLIFVQAVFNGVFDHGMTIHTDLGGLVDEG